MKKFLVFLSVIMIAAIGVYLNSNGSDEKRKINEDAYLDAVALVTKYGYPIESHEVQTEDGYLLTVHRIPSGKSKKSKSRGPVLLVHGYQCSSDDYIVSGPGKGLGYILADEGYDVWMGNTRGNVYSRKHVDLDTNGQKFWHYSFHELGMFDLPAMIDYVLKNTGKEKLQYIGHSQGTTSFFAMCSEKPEYNAKIKSFQALAPVVYCSNQKSAAVKYVGMFVEVIDYILEAFGKLEWLPRTRHSVKIAHKICVEDSPYFFLCKFVLNSISGSGLSHIDMDMLPIYMSHFPAGTSSRQQTHYKQLNRSGKFRQFDHGHTGNLKAYNSSTPPDYTLERVTVPVALYYSDNDVLANGKDVLRMKEELPNTIGVFKLPLDTFTHLDYLWAKDAKSLVYDLVIKSMKLYD